MKEWALRISLAIVSLAVGAIAAELVFRTLEPGEYYVWRPGTQRLFLVNPDAVSGVHESSRFTINVDGIRGRPFEADDDYRILAVGGSTTECLVLDDTEAWPYLVEQALSRTTGMKVWVGNVGRSGHSTRQHVYQAEKLLRQYPRIDLLLVMVGINDLLYRLAADTAYRPFVPGSDGDTALNRAFIVRPDQDEGLPVYKRTAVWRRLRAAKNRLLGPAEQDSPLFQDSTATFLTPMRANRAAASRIVHRMPDLESALAEYRSNLRRIVEFARNEGADVAFLTQPHMYVAGLPDELRSLLWMGRIGQYQATPSAAYYSVEALAVGVAAYNRTLLEFCRETGVTCIDVASMVSPDLTTFFDDVHFNESGARKVAGIVAEGLRDRIGR